MVGILPRTLANGPGDEVVYRSFPTRIYGVRCIILSFGVSHVTSLTSNGSGDKLSPNPIERKAPMKLPFALVILSNEIPVSVKGTFMDMNTIFDSPGISSRLLNQPKLTAMPTPTSKRDPVQRCT